MILSEGFKTLILVEGNTLMRKTDKKIDNQIRCELTIMCEEALKNIKGFEWLTHTADFSNFPQSLKVYFIFDERVNINNYLESHRKNNIMSDLSTAFKKINVKINNIEDYIFYDSQDDCEYQHGGNWVLRLKQH